MSVRPFGQFAQYIFVPPFGQFTQYSFAHLVNSRNVRSLVHLVNSRNVRSLVHLVNSRNISYILTNVLLSNSMITYLALSITSPSTKLIHTFLLEKIRVWILVSIELQKNVSGTHSFSDDAPLRIMDLFIPNAKRGSVQNCPKYISTVNSFDWKKYSV